MTLAPRTIRPKTKASLRFTLSGGGSVTLGLERQLAGRRMSRSARCKKPARGSRRGKPCTYFASVSGRRRIQGKAGANRVTVTNTFAGKSLKAGTYRLRLRAAGGDSGMVAFAVRSR